MITLCSSTEKMLKRKKKLKRLLAGHAWESALTRSCSKLMAAEETSFHTANTMAQTTGR